MADIRVRGIGRRKLKPKTLLGVLILATLVLFALCGIRGRKDVMTVFLPVLALILTLCAVTPVYAEFRYSFAMYTTLPLFAVIPFARPITANR